MKDSSKTTFSFVMYPEKLRLLKLIEPLKIKICIYRNSNGSSKLNNSGAGVKTPFFKNSKRNMQEKYIMEIKNTFDKSKIVKVPMYEFSYNYLNKFSKH